MVFRRSIWPPFLFGLGYCDISKVLFCGLDLRVLGWRVIIGYDLCRICWFLAIGMDPCDFALYSFSRFFGASVFLMFCLRA